MATATTATGLDTSVADSLRQALRRLRGRATAGDVMAATGLAQADAESGLKQLLETYQGHVEVGEEGDIVYAFQRRLLRRDHTPLWVRLRSTAARVLKTAFKIWIVVMLVVYFVVFVTLLIAAVIAASRGNDRNGGSILGGGRHRGGGFNFPFLFWLWTPDWRLGQPYYGSRFERRSGKKVPFYKKVFAFVFGPDRPRPSLRDRDRGVIRLIRARKGTLTVPELVRHGGLTVPEAEEEMGRLMGAYGGDVHVSRGGELVYSFGDLLVSAHGRVKVRVPAPAWQRLEKAAEFTGNKTGTNVLVGSLNGFNLLAALTAPVLIFPPLGLGGLGAEIGLIWVPAVFSTLFFAVPLGRWIGHRAENARRRLRNVRKVLLGMVFRQSLAGGSPLSAERATDDMRIALVDPNIGAADVRNQLQKMSAEFDAEVEPADSGQITYRFPAIRSALLGGEEVRSALRLDRRKVGRVVYSSADTPEEESARALANFDRELRKSVSASDQVRYLDDFELAGIDTPSPTRSRVKAGAPSEAEALPEVVVRSGATGVRMPGGVRPSGAPAVRLLATSFALLVVPVSLTAQQTDDGGIPALAVLPHDEAPEARALRTPTDIRIDGRLDEAPWSDAAPVTQFTQMDPNEGFSVSERTEVRFLYDDDALYVGARLLDSAPVTTRLARRDAGVPDSDFFTVTVDSYHDHRTAYRFSTNPSRMKRDEILSGGSGIFGGGRGDGRGDSSWDPVWDVATSVTDDGWFVEMRIPFSQLRFSTDADQVWGLQIERAINRNQERAVFSFTPKLEPGGVARFGHLNGIENVASGRRLEILPYAGLSAEYIRQTAPAEVSFSNPFRSGSDYFGRAGADLKYRLGSNLTLDATVNPDFGQVEVDPAVINLTAFETRFDERRPFFVEGGEIFQFARGGPGGSTGRPPTVMYSRRIGRRPQGPMASDAVFSDAPTSTTILGAAKISGKVGDGWSVGLLEAVTGREMAPYVDAGGARGETELEPATNYLAGRLRRDLRDGLTQLGAMATAVNRNLSAGALDGRLHSSAYVGGVDFIHEWDDRSWRINGALSQSLVSGSAAALLRTQRSSARYFQRPDGKRALDPDATSMGGQYAMFDINKQSGSFTARIAMASISPGYEVNDIGFQTEADRIMLDTHLTWRQPRPGTWLRNWAVSGGPDGKWNTAGDRLHSEFNVNLNWQWLNYWGGSVRGAVRAPTDNDRLTRGGPLARDPQYYAGNANLSSDSRQPVSGRASYNWAFDEVGSWSHTGSLNVSYKSGEKLELHLGPRLTRSYAEAQYVTSRDDPLATATFGRRYIFAPIDQTTLSLATRLNVTFSPTLTLQVYAQPLISSGDYGGLKEFRAPGTFDFLRYGEGAGTMYRLDDGGFLIDPDGAGAAPEITIRDQDFNVRSLRGNAVLRWEWSPGSTLFLVWQQRRYHRALRDAWDPRAADGIGDFDFRYDAGELVRIRPDNIFLIKVNYWLNL